MKHPFSRLAILTRGTPEAQNERKTRKMFMGKQLIYKDLTNEIIAAAISVHKELGSGFNERIYESALAEELRLRNIPFERQKIVDVFYRGKKVGYYKLDLIVGNTVVVELKTLNHLENFYLSQLISYLRATRLKVGLVLNFATPTLEIKRVINSELL